MLNLDKIIKDQTEDLKALYCPLFFLRLDLNEFCKGASQVIPVFVCAFKMHFVQSSFVLSKQNQNQSMHRRVSQMWIYPLVHPMALFQTQPMKMECFGNGTLAFPCLSPDQHGQCQLCICPLTDPPGGGICGSADSLGFQLLLVPHSMPSGEE